MKKTCKNHNKDRISNLIPQLFIKPSKKEQNLNKVSKSKLKVHNTSHPSDMPNVSKNTKQIYSINSFNPKPFSINQNSTHTKNNSTGRESIDAGNTKSLSKFHSGINLQSNNNAKTKSTNASSYAENQLKNSLSYADKNNFIPMKNSSISKIEKNNGNSYDSSNKFTNTNKELINRLKNQSSNLKCSINCKNNLNNKKNNNKNVKSFQLEEPIKEIHQKNKQSENYDFTKGINILSKHETFNQNKHKSKDKTIFNKTSFNYFQNVKNNNYGILNIEKNTNLKIHEMFDKNKSNYNLRRKSKNTIEDNNNDGIKQIITEENKIIFNHSKENKENENINNIKEKQKMKSIDTHHHHKHRKSKNKEIIDTENINKKSKKKESLKNKQENTTENNISLKKINSDIENNINKKSKSKKKLTKKIEKHSSKNKKSDSLNKIKKEKNTINNEEIESPIRKQKNSNEINNKHNIDSTTVNTKAKITTNKNRQKSENKITSPPRNLNQESFPPLPLENKKEKKYYIDPKICSNIKNVQIPKDYLNDIYQNLLEEENKGIIPKPEYNYMLNQKEINEQMRNILIDWIIDVHGKFGFCDETLYMTILIIDRYSSIKQISRIKYQCLGITALMISCKHEEINVPKIEDFIYITDNAYEKKEVFEMEYDILENLHFNLLYPSPIKFYEYLSLNFNFNKKQHLLGKYLMESFLIDIKSIKYKSSVISCACAYIVMKFFKMSNYKESYNKKYYLLDEKWEISSGYGVKDCAQDICVFVDGINETNYLSCQKKYSTSENEKVAKLIGGKTNDKEEKNEEKNENEKV